MDKYGVNTAEKLTDAAMNSDFNYSFIDNNKKGDLTRLEGYLFPDTYEFFVDEDPTHAVCRDCSTTSNAAHGAMSSCTQVEASGYSLDEILTIASLIEKETDGTDRDEHRLRHLQPPQQRRRDLPQATRSTPRSSTASATRTARTMPARSRSSGPQLRHALQPRVCTRACRPRPSANPGLASIQRGAGAGAHELLLLRARQGRRASLLQNLPRSTSSFVNSSQYGRLT